jgi:uncharacterized protein YwgA
MDNKTWVAYSKVHEYLMNRYPSHHTYDDRIIGQKVGYLCASSGIYLGEGLNFYWYKRGPYSKVLASIMRHIERNKLGVIDQCSKVKLRGNALPKLDHIKRLIDECPDTCTEVYWLEICASLRFLNKEYSTEDYNTLSKILLRRKPFLKSYSNEIKYSWNLLFNH